MGMMVYSLSWVMQDFYHQPYIWRSRYVYIIRGIRLMIEIPHYLKDPKLWELWCIPYSG